MLTSGVIGAHAGARLSSRMPACTLRILLVPMVVAVVVKMAVDVVMTPEEAYSLAPKR